MLTDRQLTHLDETLAGYRSRKLTAQLERRRALREAGYVPTSRLPGWVKAWAARLAHPLARRTGREAGVAAPADVVQYHP